MLRKMLGPNGFWPADAMAAKVRQQIAQISAVRVKGRRSQGGLDPQIREKLTQRLREGARNIHSPIPNRRKWSNRGALGRRP